MSVRFDVMGQLSVLAICAVLGCGDDDPGDDGGGAGKSPTAGTANGGTQANGGTENAGGTSSGGVDAGVGGGDDGKSRTTFFVTSDTSTTGNLGGLDAADARCQALADLAGIGDHTFHAYLSTSDEDARDRIGEGPWVNSKGVTLAADLAELHSGDLIGDHTLFIDENGDEIDGQWNSSPESDWSNEEGPANQHDIYTGSKADGTLQPDATCQDWTSDAEEDKGQVGHSDGMGPGMATTGTYTSWNSAHAGASCAETWKAGGAGKLYCFAID